MKFSFWHNVKRVIGGEYHDSKTDTYYWYNGEIKLWTLCKWFNIKNWFFIVWCDLRIIWLTFPTEVRYWWYRTMPWYIKYKIFLPESFYGYKKGQVLDYKAFNPVFDLQHKSKRWIYCGKGIICLLN